VIFCSDHTTVKELAALLGQKAFQIIADAIAVGHFRNREPSLGFKAISQLLRVWLRREETA